MNIFIIRGRLVKSPEIGATAGVKPITTAKFTLAVNRGRKNKDGAYDADFIQLKAYDKNAETIDRYVVKGQEIEIVGHITTGKYEGKDGKTVFYTDHIVDRFEFVGKKGETESTPDDNPIPQGFSATDEDIPF